MNNQLGLPIDEGAANSYSFGHSGTEDNLRATRCIRLDFTEEVRKYFSIYNPKLKNYAISHVSISHGTPKVSGESTVRFHSIEHPERLSVETRGVFEGAGKHDHVIVTLETLRRILMGERSDLAINIDDEACLGYVDEKNERFIFPLYTGVLFVEEDSSRGQ